MLTENKLTEFKREYVDDIKNTVVAFANTDGGTLYIGVNDDGTVCGVQELTARCFGSRMLCVTRFARTSPCL